LPIAILSHFIKSPKYSEMDLNPLTPTENILGFIAFYLRLQEVTLCVDVVLLLEVAISQDWPHRKMPNKLCENQH
jgi:hypothetical protein